MYTPLEKSTRNIWPLVALCCLFMIGFLIAVTIILALIPIYLPKKTLTRANITSPDDKFYLQYTASVPYSSSKTGTVTDLSQVGSGLGLGSSGTVVSGSAQAGIQRRKRSLSTGYRRYKRTLQTNFLFIVQLSYSVGCATSVCHQSERTKLHTTISSKTNMSNFKCTIRSGGKSEQLSFNLGFIGIISTKPVGFAGESSTFKFVANKSGLFNDPNVWADGIVPYGNCSVAIVAGVTIRFPRPKMEIRLRQIDVYGSLVLGEGSSTFDFDFSININVRGSGSVQDKTTGKRFRLPTDSIISVLNGGSFGEAGSVIQTIVSGNPGTSITLSSASGPLTCGLLPDGTMQSFNSITFIAVRSGDFTSDATFLGGIPPSSDMCSGGCDIQVQSGVTLSTAGLNGVMSVSISSINVLSGAGLELGTPGSSDGFKFLSPVNLKISGSMAFVGSGGNLMLPPNSIFDIADGGSFSSAVAVGIQIFDPSSGANIGSAQSLGTRISGGRFSFVIGSNGTFSLSGNASAVSDINNRRNSTESGTMTNTTHYTAIKSGDFNDPAVWGGSVPTDDSTVSIIVGVIISLSGPTFNIRIKQWNIYGTLSLGQGSASFTFVYPLQMFVRGGGKVDDLTSGKHLILSAGSAITVLTGGTFGSVSTTVQVSTSGAPSSSISLITTAGPLTIVVLMDNSIVLYNKVTFVAFRSGSFTSGDTFIGGFAPSAELCTESCNVDVLSGVVLDTADLDGILGFNIAAITVKAGGTLKLGKAGSAAGFKFSFPIQLLISGLMTFEGIGGSIFIPAGSKFSIANGGSFSSNVVVSLLVYDPATGLGMGSSFSLGTFISGGTFEIIVSISGSISSSGTATISNGSGGVTAPKFTLSKSGDFDDPSVWGGKVPTDDSVISIPVGLTISLSGSTFRVRIKQWDLAGTLSLGDGSASFTFIYSLKLLLRSGAKVKDMTSGKLIILPVNSVLTILTGSTFGAINTKLMVSGSGNSVTLTNVAGPFTVVVFANGLIQFYNQVTFIVSQSGSFKSIDAFMGGFAPSAALCTGGCDVEVQSGAVLSTDDLDGVLNFQVVTITVKSGGTLKLGKAGSAAGFKFSYAIQLSISGVMLFEGSGGSILLPSGSTFDINTGGSFMSTYGPATLQAFDRLTDALIGIALNMGTSISSGNYHLIVRPDGSFAITGIGPGASSGGVTTAPALHSTVVIG